MLRASVITACLLVTSSGWAGSGKVSIHGARDAAASASATPATPATPAPSAGAARASEHSVEATPPLPPAIPLLPAPAVAHQSSSMLVSDQARQLFDQAARAFGEGRNAEAVLLFKRANELSPNSRFHYNIGLAYEDMGDAARALDAYRQYLRAEIEQEDREDTLERVTQLQAELVALGVQQLTVMSDPAGAMLIIDGKTVGITPWTGELTLGSHELELQTRDRADTRLAVWLGHDDPSEVNVRLTPAVQQPSSEPSLVAHAPVEQPWLMKLQPATWTLAAAGTAAIAGGVLFEMLRAADDRRAVSLTGLDADRASRSAGVKQAAALTLLGTGAALWVASGVMAGFDLAGESTEDRSTATRRATWQRVAGSVAPGFVGVSASGTF